MPEKVRVHTLRDLGLGRHLFENLLNAAGRVAGITVHLKGITNRVLSQVGSEFLHEGGEDEHRLALPTFGLGDQDHLLAKEDVFSLDAYELLGARRTSFLLALDGSGGEAGDEILLQE